MASLSDRIAAARARADAAVAAVSSADFLAEESARKELAEQEERERTALARARDVMIARMLDTAPDGSEAVAIESLPHVFIVHAAGSAAFKRWQTGVRDAASGAIAKGTRTKVDTDDVNHAYTVAGIVGWNANGADVDLEDSENGVKLNTFLRENPAIVTQVMQHIQRLDGAASEARKR